MVIDRTPDPDDREDLQEQLGLIPREAVIEKRVAALAEYGDVEVNGREV